MIDKATCATPETTNSSPLSIGAVENEGVHAAVKARSNSSSPVSTQTQRVQQNEVASNTVHRLSKDVGQNTDQDTIDNRDDFQESMNSDALDNSIVSTSENSSFNCDFSEDVLVLRERMLAAEDALRLRLKIVSVRRKH